VLEVADGIAHQRAEAQRARNAARDFERYDRASGAAMDGPDVDSETPTLEAMPAVQEDGP